MELLGVHYVRPMLNASTVPGKPAAPGARAIVMVRREPRSPAFEFPTPKGLIANRVHCPATLLNGERRHPSGGMSHRTIRGLNYERRAEGAFVPAVGAHGSEVRHGVGA